MSWMPSGYDPRESGARIDPASGKLIRPSGGGPMYPVDPLPPQGGGLYKPPPWLGGGSAGPIKPGYDPGPANPADNPTDSLPLGDPNAPAPIFRGKPWFDPGPANPGGGGFDERGAPIRSMPLTSEGPRGAMPPSKTGVAPTNVQKLFDGLGQPQLMTNMQPTPYIPPPIFTTGQGLGSGVSTGKYDPTVGKPWANPGPANPADIEDRLPPQSTDRQSPVHNAGGQGNGGWIPPGTGGWMPPRDAGGPGSIPPGTQPFTKPAVRPTGFPLTPGPSTWQGLGKVGKEAPITMPYTRPPLSGDKPKDIPPPITKAPPGQSPPILAPNDPGGGMTMDKKRKPEIM